MLNSKLIQLLITFSKAELKNFGKFVRSPFFYKDKAVIKLYNSVKIFYPEFDNELLTKQQMYEKMFPHKKFSDSQMKYLMSELFKLAKMFLSYKNYNDDYFEKNNRMLKELNSRNTEKIFESELKKIESQTILFQTRNKEYFYQMYKMREIVSDFYSYKNRLSTKRKPGKIIENIINNFLISLLDSYYEITNDAVDYWMNIDLNLLSFIEDYINQHKDIVNPAVLIYYYMFMVSYRKEQLYYNRLLELKKKYLHILDEHGKHRIFETLGNYCIIHYQQGGIKYYKEAFNLINDEIINGIRFNRKEFSEIFFTNKVEIAAKIKEFDWAHNFIGKYKDRLNNEHKGDIVNFSYSIIEFENRNYRASLDRLSKINLQHPLLRFRIRNYSLLNYYELGNYEQAFLMLDAYRHMLEKDKKVEAERKKRYSLFLFYYQKLLDMKSGRLKNETELLKTGIEKNAVFMKSWLLEKVDEL
jgi:hypothetical protein